MVGVVDRKGAREGKRKRRCICWISRCIREVLLFRRKLKEDWWEW
jgi:hypothetical protein